MIGTVCQNGQISISFNVYRSSADQNFIKVNSEPIEGLTYTDNSVENGITYYYKITACSGVYETEYSNVLSAQPLDFPMNQGLLVVDETRDGNGSLLNPTTDEEVDGFYNRVIANNYTSWDVVTQGVPDVNVFRLYSMIIWHDDDTIASVINDTVQQGLASYVVAGGKVILSGWKTANSITNSYLNELLMSDQKVSINTSTFASAVS